MADQPSSRRRSRQSSLDRVGAPAAFDISDLRLEDEILQRLAAAEGDSAAEGARRAKRNGKPGQKRARKRRLLRKRKKE